MDARMREIEAANQFWADARERVLGIAKAAGRQIHLEKHDDQFLFDLYDEGDNIPTDEEILAAVEELEEVQQNG